jgi:flagellar hook-length control protein FliK
MPVLQPALNIQSNQELSIRHPTREADRPAPERFGSAMREANVALKRPNTAAPKNQGGKDSPPRDLHAVRLGPKVKLITPKAAPPDQASLVDFARNQGMSQDMLALLRNAARPAASPDGSAMNPDANQAGLTQDGGDGSALSTAGSDAALLDAMQAAAAAANQTSAQALSALAAQAAQLVAQSTAQQTAQQTAQAGTPIDASAPSSALVLGAANPGSASAINLQALFDRPLQLLPGNAGDAATNADNSNGRNPLATIPSAGTLPGTLTGQAADAASQAAALLAAGLAADRKAGTDKPMGSNTISGNGLGGNGLGGNGLGDGELQSQDANAEAGATAKPASDDVMASVKLSVIDHEEEPGRPARFLADQGTPPLNERTLNDRAQNDRAANDRLSGAGGLDSAANLSGNPATNDATATQTTVAAPSTPSPSALNPAQAAASPEARLDLGKQVPDTVESFHEAYLKGSEAYEQLSEKLGKVLGERLSAQIARGEWSLRLQLSPAHLGAIDIRLQMRKGELNAVFGAAEAHTRDLLSDGMQQLRDSLAQSGLQLSQSDVQADARGAGHSQSAAAQNASAQSGGNGSASGQRAQAAESSALLNTDDTATSQGSTLRKAGSKPDGLVDVLA